MAALPTGTVSFLFTDIEGSTRLWEGIPDAMAAAVARHDAMLLGAIADHDGHVFSTSGDGMAAAFARAQEAVAAALQAQLAMSDADWKIEALRVRMAIHTGEADERDGNYFGRALNETGRLLGSGHGGQVLISGATREVLGSQLADGMGLRDLGEHRLRDVTRPLRIFQLTHPRLEGDFPRLRTADPAPSTLPLQLTSLVGRHEELARVEKLLTEGRLVTLMGAGGSGKTRLAVETASRWEVELPGAVWFVDLTPVSEPDLVKSTVVRALGLTESSEAEALDRLCEFLQPQTGLLVLDNCEHVRDAASSLVATVLRRAPGVKVLTTSREPLGLQGEAVWQVPPLPVPPADAAPDDLLHFDSIQLFEERAAAASPGFRITEDNADAAKRICRRLDGIPLGIELAAARLRVIAPDELAKRLEESLAVLGSAGRDVVPHHRTLEATLEWSYQLLAPHEQAMLARLSVFAGGWTLEAAEEIGAEAAAAEPVLDVLASLIDKSLVVVAESRLGTRHRLLEPIRQYARGKLTASAAEPAARQRHAAYFAELAEAAYPNFYSAHEGLWLDRLDADIDNLREALASLLEIGDIERGQLMAGALLSFWGRTHRDEEAIGWQERLLRGEERPGTARARALVLSNLHPLEEAAPHHRRLDEAVALYREWGPERELILALLITSGHADATGEWQAALRMLEEALGRARIMGEPALITLGAADVASTQIRWAQDLEAAAPLSAEAEVAARALGSPNALHTALTVAADLEEARGNLDAAAAPLTEALELEQRSGFRLAAVGIALTRLAEIALIQGRLELAVDRLVEQRKQIEALGYGEARFRDRLRRESLRILGEVEIARGNHHRGVVLLSAHATLIQPQVLEVDRQQRFDAALALVRAELGDEAFTRLWGEGVAMSLEQALEYGAQSQAGGH